MKHLLILIAVLCVQQSLMAQAFEIRLNRVGNSTMTVQLRETSGNNTPTTSNQVTDIAFGIKWPSTCNLDINNIENTSYNINKSGTVGSVNNFNYQAFFANNTPFSIPNNWVVNQWETVATISTNGADNCTFEITETGFHFSTDPNVGIDLNDFEPTINGSAEMGQQQPACPSESDIDPASDSANSCNNANGNTITLPMATVSGANAANATYQWTSSTVSNIPAGQNPSVTLPQNTACDAVTHSFSLAISCTEDNTVSLNGGNVTYEVYPEPKAPTITKDDNVCNYTVTPACPNDDISPNTIPAQTPETAGLTQDFEVSNDGCVTSTFNVLIPACESINCGWEIESVDTECDAPTFLVCLTAKEAITDVEGVDYHFAYPTSIRPTGNSEIRTDLYSNPEEVRATFNINEATSQLDGGVNFEQSAPASAKFNGIGTLICVEFEFTEDFDGTTLPIVTSDFVLEAYEGQTIEDCAIQGIVNVDTDNQHTGYLYAWGNSQKALYDSTQNSITYIKKANNICTTTGESTQLQENGAFSVNWTEKLELSRWNEDCQEFGYVVGGHDAFLVSLIANRDTSFYIPDVRALIAGDVNEDGNTNSGDATNILQRSVGKECQYFVQPGRVISDWKFIESEVVNIEPTWTLDSGYPNNDDNGADWRNVPITPQCFTIPQGDDNCGRTSMVYEAILKGDVDGNWNRNNYFRTVAAGELVVDVENATSTQTNTYTIPIYYKGEEQVNAVDIRLNAQETLPMTFESVVEANENLGLEFDYNVSADNSLLIAAFTVNPTGLPTNEPLFYLTVSTPNSLDCIPLSNGTVHFNGAEGTLSCKMAEEPTVGIENFNTKIDLYPNPTKNQVTITYGNTIGKNTTIKAFDYTGKLVQQHTDLPTQNKFTMNTQNMSSGIYFIVLEQDGQVIGREKLVIVK